VPPWRQRAPLAGTVVPRGCPGHTIGDSRQRFTDTEVTKKIRAPIAAIGTAAALGITGAVVLPAAASAHAVTHTLTFTSVEQGQAKFSATSSGFEDKAVNKAGKVIGYDVLNVTVNPATGTVSAWVTLNTAGGLLYGTMKVSRNPVSHGTVTGGTGAFAGAIGAITAKSISASKTTVTITYHT